MHGAVARQLYRKIEWNPTDMSSPTQITSGTVQPAQQDARSTDAQKTGNKPEPRTRSPADHKGLYRSNRPTWTKSLKADSKKQGAADAAKLAENTGLPQPEEHIAAPRTPPAHIELLDTQDREKYTELWTTLPAAPKHGEGLRVDQTDRMAALENIGTLQVLDAKCMDVLQSRLATTEPSVGRDKLNTLEKKITQSKADLHDLFSSFQRNALYGMPPAKAVSAA